MIRPPPNSTLFPYPPLFQSARHPPPPPPGPPPRRGRLAGAPRPPHRALPLAAVPRGRAVHGHPGRLRADRRHRAVLPRGARRQARRPARVRVLPQGLDRSGRGGRQGLLQGGRRLLRGAAGPGGAGAAGGECGGRVLVARTPFKVEILTPEGEVFNDEVEMVSTKTSVGSIGILANHQPLLAMLDPTELRLYKSESDVIQIGRAHV